MAQLSQDFEYTFKLSFKAEWFDPVAEHKKNFVLSFFPCDNTIELFDVDCKRVYLKRSAYERLRLKDIFVGNVILLYGRQISVVDYADCMTQKFIGKWKEHTFSIIKPSGMSNLGVIIDEVYENNFIIDRMRMAHLNRKDTLDLYAAQKGDAFLPFIIEHISSAPIIAMELVGENSIERWRTLIGPSDPVEARKSDPTCFRARFGSDLAANAVHGSRSHEDALRSACFFFPQGIDRRPPASTAKINNTCCCVVKPHVVEQGNLGKLIAYITNAGFVISALQMFYLSYSNAVEFLEVYKGVISDFNQLLHSFLNGPVVALEISGKSDDMNVHAEFRRFCGPRDSNVAKQIRPLTLRGVFGVDRYHNACHCTDLAEDTALELEYFFKIMDA